MKRVNAIWNHRVYQESLRRIEKAEENRIFCKHTPEHFLDVARLSYILALEQGIEVDRELIYGAAFLHDVGRFRQYEEGIPHDIASVEIAGRILEDCDFTEEEQQVILGMISAHRTKSEVDDLNGIFYRADKMSRNCYACKVQEACNWAQEKKNLEIVY